jgi:hypothetical protein
MTQSSNSLINIIDIDRSKYQHVESAGQIFTITKANF